MSARSNGSVRRLKSLGTRSGTNGSAQTASVPSHALLHEDHLPVVEAQRDQVAVVVEVDEALARALLLLAGQVRQQVVAVDVHLERLAAGLVPFLAASRRCRARRPPPGTSAASRGAGRSRWRPTPAGILPGQRTSSGTRNAPSQLVFFSLRNGVIAPSGQVFMCGPLSVLYMTIVLSAMPSSSSRVEHLADVLVVVDHRVVVRRLPAARLPEALRLGVRAEVHVRGVEPAEEGLAGLRAGA